MIFFLKVYRRCVLPVFWKIKYSLQGLLFSNSLLVNYWIPPRSFLGAYNYGDDINIVLMGLISGRKIVPYRFSCFTRKRTNYLCIGSIVTQLSNPKAVVWGSGVIDEDRELAVLPQKVCAVRGPLSRAFLLARGVECPEIYGDPALLLPLYYKPEKVKKYKLGIIPHYRDKYASILEKYRNMEDVYIFDVQNYGDWRAFLQKICECELILSSSLHGIIIADAYGIPNCWVEFARDLDKSFKFKDYFLSVKKPVVAPIYFETFRTLGEWMEYKAQWTPICFDPVRLLEVCPFIKNSNGKS